MESTHGAPTGTDASVTASPERAEGKKLHLPEDVLLEDFRQQCTNLQNQYTRMHGRMQSITGLNTALLPALGALAIAAGRNEVGRGWLFLFPTAGLLLSMIGYVAGSGDHYLVGLYRAQLTRTTRQLVQASNLGDPDGAHELWLHAGMSPSKVDDALHAVDPQSVDMRDESVPEWWDRLTSRRRAWLSATRLPAVLSLVFILAWLVVFVLLAAIGV
jgi:hypothetical protein